MRQIVRQISIYFFTLSILTVVGYLLLVLVYTIPANKFKQSLTESAPFFYAKSDPTTAPLDYFTDALMLLTAAEPIDETPWKAALINARKSVNDKSPNEVFVDIYLNQNTVVKEAPYYRYWHGYLIYLKPLLLCFNHTQICNLLGSIQLLLLFLVVSQAKIHTRFIYAVIAAWIFLNPVTTMTSLQYSTVWIITLLFLIVIFRYSEIWNETIWRLSFFIFGCMTSYFDLLTYPIVAMGIPLVTLICLSRENTILKSVKYFITLVLFWLTGYTSLWSCKWLLGSIVLNENLFQDAISEFLLWNGVFGKKTLDYHLLSVFYENIKWALQPGIYILTGLTFLLLLYTIGRRNFGKRKDLLVICFMTSLFPFAVYVAARNHSMVHGWFTYRNLAVFYYAINIYFLSVLELREH